jgi:dihydroorotate dehydrogenase electron transfer subunit
MRYRRFHVRVASAAGDEVKLLVADGSMEYEPGQYAFVFLPGAGEKPFSIAAANPLAFVFRRRGPHTRALWEVREGDAIYVRGPYGAAPRPPAAAAGTADIVLAGGTGVAVAPRLVRMLLEEWRRVAFFYGVSRPEEGTLAGLVPEGADRVCVPDAGQPGRVLGPLAERLRGAPVGRCWNIGPVGLMRAAADTEEAAGVPAERILLSLETPSLCGVGVCGLCEVGGRLLCREGTFVSLAALRAAGGWAAADAH